MALNATEFLVRHKIFGPSQHILGPVEGQGTSFPQSFVVSISTPN